MNFLSFFIIVISSASFAENVKSSIQVGPKTTHVQVVEYSNYAFTADTFFEHRKNPTFKEIPAKAKFQKWSAEAIEKVNHLIPSEDKLQKVKIKLIFQADILTSSGVIAAVPISIIESYQEPKTSSIRLGMLELENDEASFKITVAHEYSHLVLENASRRAGVTSTVDETMPFWSKPIYEGAADIMASMALGTQFTGSSQNWTTRDLFEFSSLERAQNAKDTTVARARIAFTKMGLIPKYEIYENWLKTIDKFIQSSGGKDPYAEGSWLAGSLFKIAGTPQKQIKLAKELMSQAKSGQVEESSLRFYETLKYRLQN